MRVRVKLFAVLRQYVPGAVYGEPINVDLSDGATLADLVEQLKLPLEETKVTFVNGRARNLDWQLAHDDEVGIFPPVGGG
jgi:molybdopterin converting factor small subunit